MTTDFIYITLADDDEDDRLFFTDAFSELKIDRRFIANFLHEAESQAIVETCINLAHKMHIRTVAEGVETAETLQALQAIGCDYAQGYFFHPPLTVPQATELLKAVVL